MWKDWDTNYSENAALLTYWFGQQVKDSVLSATTTALFRSPIPRAATTRPLQFLFKANQLGIMDPDSATQDWTTVCDSKMKQKRVYLFWYNWQNGF